MWEDSFSHRCWRHWEKWSRECERNRVNEDSIGCATDLDGAVEGYVGDGCAGTGAAAEVEASQCDGVVGIEGVDSCGVGEEGSDDPVYMEGD